MFPMSISQEMYARIYRLYKRNINIHNIASTLNIPLRTVQSVVSRIDNISEETTSDPTESTEQELHNSHTGGFLDIYLYQKTRYTIIQFVGDLTSSYIENIEREMVKALKSNWKAVALRMSDVDTLDNVVSELIMAYHKQFSTVSKFFALLDPSPKIEPLLKKFDIEGKIPVFGTERAFEDTAFSKKMTNFTKRITI
jgi:anti-anti-sigma regulatory factor